MFFRIVYNLHYSERSTFTYARSTTVFRQNSNSSSLESLGCLLFGNLWKLPNLSWKDIYLFTAGSGGENSRCPAPQAPLRGATPVTPPWGASRGDGVPPSCGVGGTARCTFLAVRFSYPTHRP